jgi:hypothetical protein
MATFREIAAPLQVRSFGTSPVLKTQSSVSFALAQTRIGGGISAGEMKGPTKSTEVQASLQ